MEFYLAVRNSCFVDVAFEEPNLDSCYHNSDVVEIVDDDSVDLEYVLVVPADLVMDISATGERVPVRSVLQISKLNMNIETISQHFQVALIMIRRKVKVLRFWISFEMYPTCFELCATDFII